MDAEKIGGFIARLRKEQGLTQQGLAEKINISDKTISKWENGKSMPDTVYLSDLSRLLGISISELLAGERFAETDYASKTEETIYSLIKDNENGKRSSVKGMAIGFAVLILAIAGMFFAITFTAPDGSAYPTCFFDLQGAAMFALISAALVAISGNRAKKPILLFLNKTVIWVGLAVSLVGLVAILSQNATSAALSANIGVSILPILYAAAVKLIVLLLIEKTV